ncbi:DUF2341 domain-containing protein [bacterium]|jgi:hypothetical protein|nr:DUF2341 domain-containing protein [bacterium]
MGFSKHTHIQYFAVLLMAVTSAACSAKGKGGAGGSNAGAGGGTPGAGGSSGSGTPLTVANISISDAPTFDFGFLNVGLAGSKTFTLSSNGTAAASNLAAAALSAPFSFKGGNFPGTGGDCATLLDLGQSCTVVVDFTPSADGAASGSLQINFTGGSTSVALQGTGTSPNVSISNSPAYDFGSVNLGASGIKLFTLSNSGTGHATGLSAAALSAPFSFAGGSYPGTGGDCGNQLNAGASCLVGVSFAPVSNGAASGSLVMNFDGGSKSVALAGMGTSPSVAISDAPGFNFGLVNVGTDSIKLFTISNSGSGAALNLSAAAPSSPFNFVGGSYPGSGGNCGNSLAAGANCTVAVLFAPGSAGPASSALAVSYTGGSASISLSGTGATATLAISGAPSYDFGGVNLGQSGSKSFTISNSGSGGASAVSAVALSAPFSFVGGSYPGTGGNCGVTLAAGENCTVVVAFAPTANGAASGKITINYNAGSAEINLAGTGTSPSLAISDGATYNFGSVAVGSSANKSFTVSNSGTGMASSLVAAALSAPFSFVGGNYPGVGGTCGVAIAAGANCTIAVSYAPSAAGVSNANLSLTYTGGSVARAMTGTGTIVPPVQLAFVGPSGAALNVCIPMSVRSQTAAGVDSAVSASTTVTLKVNNGTATFYSNSGCTTAITSTAIAANQSASNIYIKATTAPQSLTLVATSASLLASTMYYTIGNAPSKLSLSLPPHVLVANCKKLTVSRLDNLGNRVAAAGAVTVNLTQDKVAKFYSDSACSAQVASVSIAAFAQGADFYFIDNTIETVAATGTDPANGLSPDTKSTSVVSVLPWWNNMYKKRIRIGVNNLDQNNAFTNMPVMVKLNASRIDYANTAAKGADIRVIASDNSTALPFEIESWNTSGDSVIWVKVPSVAASSDAGYFYIYYNNASALDAQDINNTWSSYWGVWHLGESQSGTAPQFKDSTANRHDGTAINSPTSVAGAIGKGVATRGGHNFDAIDVGVNLAPIIGQSSSFSAWMKTTQVGNDTMWQAPGLTGVESNGDGNDIFFGWIDASGRIGVTAGDGANAKSGFVVNDNAWRHVSITRDMTSGAIKFYINGVLNGTGASSAGYKTAAFSRFGMIADTGGTDEDFAGTMDEIRLYNTVQDDARMKADFKFMVDTNINYYDVEATP